MTELELRRALKEFAVDYEKQQQAKADYAAYMQRMQQVEAKEALTSSLSAVFGGLFVVIWYTMIFCFLVGLCIIFPVAAPFAALWIWWDWYWT